jgi:hypothetical protein
MNFDQILKNKYRLLNEQPPAELPEEPDAETPAEAPEAAAPEAEQTEQKLDTQGVAYLVDLVRKALIIDKISDKEKADLLNLTVDANNAFNTLENKIIPILNKYIPESSG